MTATVDYTRHGDADLVAFVRAGTVAAFGPLYERHVTAATRRTRYFARCSAEADALVSDGFMQVLEALLAGGGPTESFSAYLWRTITNLAFARSRKEAREVPTEAPPVDDAGRGHVRQESFLDLAIEGVVDRALVVRAFERLPGTSQQVLWYTEVLNMSPAEAAPILEIAPGAVAARAHRARDDLRTAWLAAHVDTVRPAGRCKAIVDELGGWIRQTLRTRRRSAVEQHLGGCLRCRKLVAELATLNAIPPAMPARVHGTRSA
ncbi:sigma-70 family RNA polymerase sigma factor [Lentzea sp. NPDC004782]|uniref:sigma-70 family RNA polymerase sigma factor n=1 Tax=Lentzea sp. NPDC004782 TaxID=3154458 RepID=UPI0033B73715